MNGRFAMVVDQRGASLSAGNHETLVLTHADGRRERVGMKALGSLVLHGDVALSTSVLQRLAAHGVSLTILPLRGRIGAAGFSQMACRHPLRRHAQHLAYANPVLRMAFARDVVRAKCAAMADFAHRHAPDEDGFAYRAMASVSDAPTIAALMGVEAAATVRHFEHLARAFERHAVFHFPGRRRQPPTDPVNAMMSLCYTLAEAEAARMGLAQGLDVQLGFLHGPQRQRLSLAHDLVEPARAALDHWVWELLVQRRVLTPDLFSEEDGGAVLLTKAGRALFYPLWFSEGWLRARDPIRRLLARLLTNLRSIEVTHDAGQGVADTLLA